MEDVGRAPADVSPVQTEPASIPTLDGWIESLMSCKQLAEVDVQRLCDKVRGQACTDYRSWGTLPREQTDLPRHPPIELPAQPLA